MKNKSIIHGIAASALLLALYFTIVGILQGLGYAVSRFIELWYFMAPLVIGFGFQIGLFSHIHSMVNAGAKTAVASGGMSAGSMVACCAHHVTDVAPLIGVSAIGIFLLEYQSAFLVLGLVSNAIGILFMMSIAKKNGMKFKNSFMKGAMKYDFRKLMKIAAVIGVVIIILAFILVKPPQIQEEKGINLAALSDDQNAVTFDVDPLPFTAADPVKFDVSINTHSVALNFAPDEISTLLADGKELKAISWEGSGPGGHHRSGTLTFPPLGTVPKNLKLVMKSATGADSIFEWNL